MAVPNNSADYYTFHYRHSTAVDHASLAMHYELDRDDWKHSSFTTAPRMRHSPIGLIVLCRELIDGTWNSVLNVETELVERTSGIEIKIVIK